MADGSCDIHQTELTNLAKELGSVDKVDSQITR